MTDGDDFDAVDRNLSKLQDEHGGKIYLLEWLQFNPERIAICMQCRFRGIVGGAKYKGENARNTTYGR